MNSINETLLEAFSTVVDTKIKDLAYDKTIQAEITKIIDVNTGEYKAKYNGNVFSVYSNDLSYWYKVGTRVLVKVPEGDFSNKKTIENTVTSKSLSDEEAAATSN
jgi:glutamine cyclotransferase